MALLQLSDGQLEKLRLQKLLFLLTRKQETPVYDFVPYRFGCFSFSAAADLKTMVANHILKENENSISLNDQQDYYHQLKPADKNLLTELADYHRDQDTTSIIKYTYLRYPFFAINSEMAGNLLDRNDLKKVEESRPRSNATMLFTIGYEGISLEEYLVRLLKHDVKVLVDVRNNPQSMKWGFSKNLLKKYCEHLGISYVHFPELGITSEQRQGLCTQDDYSKLFENYRQNTLSHTTQSQMEVFRLLNQHQRIALTCFEADIHQCHRKHLAEAVSKLPGFTYEVKHI